jgi:hypothetical protein
MRWSGLAIRDAVTLERRRLNTNGELFLYRAKNRQPGLRRLEFLFQHWTFIYCPIFLCFYKLFVIIGL